jgi:hypothetical protein
VPFPLELRGFPPFDGVDEVPARAPVVGDGCFEVELPARASRAFALALAFAWDFDFDCDFDFDFDFDAADRVEGVVEAPTVGSAGVACAPLAGGREARPLPMLLNRPIDRVDLRRGGPTHLHLVATPRAATARSPPRAGRFARALAHVKPTRALRCTNRIRCSPSDSKGDRFFC